VIRENLASLSCSDVLLAEIILLDVVPEDFKWDHWGAGHRFFHLAGWNQNLPLLLPQISITPMSCGQPALRFGNITVHFSFVIGVQVIGSMSEAGVAFYGEF
jgi:hypothetical protein